MDLSDWYWTRGKRGEGILEYKCSVKSSASDRAAAAAGGGFCRFLLCGFHSFCALFPTNEMEQVLFLMKQWWLLLWCACTLQCKHCYPSWSLAAFRSIGPRLFFSISLFLKKILNPESWSMRSQICTVCHNSMVDYDHVARVRTNLTIVNNIS